MKWLDKIIRDQYRGFRKWHKALRRKQRRARRRLRRYHERVAKEQREWEQSREIARSKSHCDRCGRYIQPERREYRNDKMYGATVLNTMS